MSRKKDQERKQQAAAHWMAMTPQEHLDQAADIWGAIIGTPDEVQDRLTALTHAQTHLLAGLLKLGIAGQPLAGEREPDSHPLPSSSA